MVDVDKPIAAGKDQARMEFHYDGYGLAKAGEVTLCCYALAPMSREPGEHGPTHVLFGKRNMQRWPRHRLAMLAKIRAKRQQIHQRNRFFLMEIGSYNQDQSMNPQNRLRVTLPSNRLLLPDH